MFAVVRHPDIESLGIIPESALALHRSRGFYRVSDWRNEPADFYLPDFAESFSDLDAEPDKPARPAAPEKEEEQ